MTMSYPPTSTGARLPDARSAERRHPRLRLIWILLVLATVCLIFTAWLFDDGALQSAGSGGRLIMGSLALTVGGTLGVLAVLEAWQTFTSASPTGDGEPRQSPSPGSPAGPT